MNRKALLELFEEHPFCSFYSYRYEDEDVREFDNFFDKFDTAEFKQDMDKILYWMSKVGADGAHDRCFRPERGRLIAMPMESSNLRLFCYKISDGIVLFGNGGKKITKKFNDDPILNAHAKNLESIGKILMSQINKGSVQIYNNQLYSFKPISFKTI